MSSFTEKLGAFASVAADGAGKGWRVARVLTSPGKLVKKAVDEWVDPEGQPAILTASAAGALILGRKATAAGLMMQAVRVYERQAQQAAPELSGALRDRLDRALAQYQSRHTHRVTRIIHMASLPLIAGGAVGMLASRPLFPVWTFSVAAFGAGSALNIGAQVALEEAPLLEGGDPLSLAVGPVWDLFHPRQALE